MLRAVSADLFLRRWFHDRPFPRSALLSPPSSPQPSPPQQHNVRASQAQSQLNCVFTYDGPFTYTPNVQVDLFAVDSAGIPVDSNTNDTYSYTPIATAFNSSVTFTGSNYNNGGDTSSTHQQMCFDFTGQTGAQNLQDFAFGYRDINPAGQVSPGFGFSLFTNPTGPTVGASNAGYLGASPNDLSATSFSVRTTANKDAPAQSIDASITCVPEPASLGLLGLGSLLTLRRRRTA